MCDAKNTRFFRPWNGNDHSKSEEVPSPVEKTVNSIVKCEQEDDSESVLSNDSVSNNSGQLEHDSRSSSARSYSVNSEDLSESSSLNMLRNFVFGSHPGHHSSSENSTISSEPCKVSTSEQTMFPANYYNSYAVYSPPECLPHFKSGLMPIDGLPGPFDYNHQHHHHLHYGLTGIPPPAYASVQEAVKYIHQQDVVAKQMRKLRPKKFRCEHCNVAFSNNGQLKGHIRIHTGERPFKCDADGCGKSFTRNEELTRHKRIHTGLRPHSCLVCGKRFGRKDHLKKHTRTHENRSPYHIPGVNLGHFAIGHHIPPPFIYPL